VDWIGLAQDRDKRRAHECGNEPLGSINAGKLTSGHTTGGLDVSSYKVGVHFLCICKLKQNLPFYQAVPRVKCYVASQIWQAFLYLTLPSISCHILLEMLLLLLQSHLLDCQQGELEFPEPEFHEPKT
jgi:hypothetical protein